MGGGDIGSFDVGLSADLSADMVVSRVWVIKL